MQPPIRDIMLARWFSHLPALVLLILLGGCNSQADSQLGAAPPRVVLAARVEPANQQDNAYTGVVAARTESDLGFRVSGKVMERRVDPGQRVRKGDTLLVLDVQDFDLALKGARNRVVAAQAQLRQRRDDAERYQRLATTGAVSRQIFDQAATNLRVAEAEMASADSDARQIENRRTYSVLRADGDGVITEVRVDRGQVVAEGQVVARLAQDGAREAVINLPENQRNLAANPARAFPFGAPEQAVEARLRELSAAADPSTRTFRARYVLDGQAERFAIGSTITVRLSSAAAEQTRVPIGALHDPGTGSGVWLIGNDNRVSFVPVQVASLGQEYAVLDGGVSPGQLIVALGAHLLHPAEQVRVPDAQSLALNRASSPIQDH
ncbi:MULTISPECIES: efflux RND transporter periplasmic adaptor subunit [Pseudomonas]|uniref:RND family efflux transporter, MFP subunit n=1 Tax=Pseudomonas asplenii TaxID=53407 RepID=A0A0N0VJR5_9PSED|nr:MULTISPECIES: efflux RND transporter periplasmic adaptor subunit [Pseudomonas]KPA90472.1 RND family efflux transporter, MFP subunit [Pseudomonas fuscovaginae]KPA99585.1 RND family efflux transporter, MFP subunit [Pseudomonas fuscovaginae]